MTAYSISVSTDKPLLTVNRERIIHYHARSDIVKAWREAFSSRARDLEIPPLGRVRIVSQPYQRRGILADPGAHYPVVKAAIDGLVDAGVLPNDRGEQVSEIVSRPPMKATEDSLHLIVETV